MGSIGSLCALLALATYVLIAISAVNASGNPPRRDEREKPLDSLDRKYQFKTEFQGGDLSSYNSLRRGVVDQVPVKLWHVVHNGRPKIVIVECLLSSPKMLGWHLFDIPICHEVPYSDLSKVKTYTILPADVHNTTKLATTQALSTTLQVVLETKEVRDVLTEVLTYGFHIEIFQGTLRLATHVPSILNLSHYEHVLGLAVRLCKAMNHAGDATANSRLLEGHSSQLAVLELNDRTPDQWHQQLVEFAKGEASYRESVLENNDLLQLLSSTNSTNEQRIAAAIMLRARQVPASKELIKNTSMYNHDSSVRRAMESIASDSLDPNVLAKALQFKERK